MRTRYLYSPSDGHLIEKYVDGECVFREHAEENSANYYIMSDIKPYRSMIDGREITSRSRHREHLREHGCVEVGNDSSLFRPPRPIESPPGLKEVVIEAVNQHQSKRRL